VNRLGSWLWLACVGAASAGAGAGEPTARDGQPPAAHHGASIQPRMVRLGMGGKAALRVERPWARTSAARPVVAPHPGKAPRELADARPITLHARVIVRFEREDARERVDPDGRAEPIAGAPGHWILPARSVEAAIDLVEELAGAEGVAEAYIDAGRPVVGRSVPTDPLLIMQWNLRNADEPQIDANLEEAWAAGFTGEGVVIGIVDLGTVQWIHPELDDNYAPEASITNESFGFHPISVCGIAVGEGNNALGGAGAAYGSRFGSMFVGPASVNATAFGHRNELIGVKNNSWGPPDDGSFHAMTGVEETALRTAATTGRGGLGTVFVWAAGNGGSSDRVDYDAYASSRHTIAVGAIDDDDDAAPYNERASSMLCVGHSSGGSSNRDIFTTDLLGADGLNPGNFNNSFGGTSASAPLGSGVVALMLEARPELTWRDVQHVLVRSARRNDPSDPSWEVNGAGHEVSDRYGFGALNAGAAVETALGWELVGPAVEIDTGVIPINEPVPDGDGEGVARQITIDRDIRVEHVELVVNIDTSWVGDLQIDLISPSGLRSELATGGRPIPDDDLVDYRFTSVRHWDESSAGTWTVRVADLAEQDLAEWLDLRLIIHGTEPEGCPADLTGSDDPDDPGYGEPDGEADARDFMFYLELFRGGDGAADLTGPGGDGVPDGDLTADDFFFYLELFAGGCP